MASRVADVLTMGFTNVWDDKAMEITLPKDVYGRFINVGVTGETTSEKDQEIIATALFTWARERGATDFAHWFFPMRGGGGATGGQLGAYKMDTLIDLDFGSKHGFKPIKACLPYERLFQGETDGSSFPNGGLRVTHGAAAFTIWDRTSPPFVWDKTLFIPCSFITHWGKCIDEKTPLLRSNDAIRIQGLRLLKALGLHKGEQQINTFLGWEQEFFCGCCRSIPEATRFGELRPDTDWKAANTRTAGRFELFWACSGES